MLQPTYVSAIMMIAFIVTIGEIMWYLRWELSRLFLPSFT